MLLIDNPPFPKSDEDREILAETRALPGKIQHLLERRKKAIQKNFRAYQKRLSESVEFNSFAEMLHSESDGQPDSEPLHEDDPPEELSTKDSWFGSPFLFGTPGLPFDGEPPTELLERIRTGSNDVLALSLTSVDG